MGEAGAGNQAILPDWGGINSSDAVNARTLCIEVDNQVKQVDSSMQGLEAGQSHSH